MDVSYAHILPRKAVVAMSVIPHFIARSWYESQERKSQPDKSLGIEFL